MPISRKALMKKFKKALSLSLLGLQVIQLVACSSANVKKEEEPQKLYKDALEEFQNINYTKATELLEKVENRAAGTPLAQQAQLQKAYIQYKAGDTLLAVATLDRFIRLNPSSPVLDYAYYLKGVVYFNDNLGLFGKWAKLDLSERDQKAAKDSFDAFAALVKRFPESKYAEDARARMRYIANNLSSYEVHVAQYYFSRGAYVAAVNRAQAAIQNHPNTPAVEEALNILAKSYEALGLNDLSKDAKRVLAKTYPNSKYLQEKAQQSK
jgi:outer membrane protein assembly factor BamD